MGKTVSVLFFALGGRVPFLPPSAAGEMLPGGSRGLQKGVQDTLSGVSAVAH